MCFTRRMNTLTNAFISYESLSTMENSIFIFCCSKDQLENMFPNPLGKDSFEFQRQHLGILCVDECNECKVEIKGGLKINFTFF